MPKNDPANIKYFECGKLEHYANACPTKEMYEEQEGNTEKNAFQTWDNASYVTYRVEAAMNPQEGEDERLSMHIQLKCTEVLLDNQVYVSVFRPC